MYGHVPQYLDAERLRLRAERAERLARQWRNAACLLLAMVVLATCVLFDSAARLHQSRQVAAQNQREIYAALDQAVYELTAKDAAEEKFRVCLSANAGLVDALHEFDALVKEQQSVIRESIDIARRCDAQPVNWVNLNEVR